MKGWSRERKERKKREELISCEAAIREAAIRERQQYAASRARCPDFVLFVVLISTSLV